jgi:cobalt-zinc-cadmium efflux system protein
MRRLGIVLALTASYTVAEIVGGLLSNSLALLADAGHMMTDNLALGIALFAAWSARRPPDRVRTYGYQRAEILAALFNGIALVAVASFIVWEAWERFRDPPVVEYRLMAAVAAGGLLVNLVGAAILHGRGRGNLNVRGAYLHVLGDMLGSIGALMAAALLAAFGWSWADPAAGMLIAGIIIVSSGRLVLESVNVLMEGVPAHIDLAEVRACLLDVPGVRDIHDLHLWSLGGAQPLLTAHLSTDGEDRTCDVLREAGDRLRDRFGIDHATLQVEPPGFSLVPPPRPTGRT